MIRNSILSTAEIFFDSTHLEIELVPIFSKFGSNENWVNIWYDPFENAGSDNKSISTNKYSSSLNYPSIGLKIDEFSEEEDSTLPKIGIARSSSPSSKVVPWKKRALLHSAPLSTPRRRQNAGWEEQWALEFRRVARRFRGFPFVRGPLLFFLPPSFLSPSLFLFPTYPLPPPSFSPLCFRFLCGSDLRQNSSLERLLSTTITPYSAICIIRGTGVVILSSLPNFPRISYFWTRGGEEKRNWRECCPRWWSFGYEYEYFTRYFCPNKVIGQVLMKPGLPFEFSYIVYGTCGFFISFARVKCWERFMYLVSIVRILSCYIEWFRSRDNRLIAVNWWIMALLPS